MAEKLGLTIKELYSKLDANEISEWMAYHHTQTDEFRDKYTPKPENEEKKIERKMTMSDKVSMYKKRTTKDETWD